MPVPDTRAPRRALLRETAYEAIRDAIVDGTLAPGEQLRDAELAAWLGVSRTPVREALLRLERARLVDARPGRSTSVAAVDLDSTLGSQRVVASMHELAARLATPHLTADDFDRLAQANGAFADALAQRDVEAALASDDAFHGVFLARAENPVIPEVLEHALPVLRRVERLRFASLDGRRSVQQHAVIIEHARAGEAEGAGRASRENWLSLRYTFE